MLRKHFRSSCLLALPQSATAVLRLSKDPDNGPMEYAVAISSDVGLTTQILKFANSSFFGFRHKITTIQTALSLICIRTVKNFVLWKAVFSFLPNPKNGPFDLCLFSQDALRRACFAKVVASYVPNSDPEELFVTALLQDVAIPILANLWPCEYEQILSKHHHDKIPVSKLEQSMFGWDHAYAGSVLIKEWEFDENLASIIGRHNEKFNFYDNDVPVENAIVQLSALLPSVQDARWKEADDFFAIFQKLKTQGKIENLPNIDELLTTTEQLVGSFKDFVPFENGSFATNSLVTLYRDYLDEMRTLKTCNKPHFPISRSACSVER